LLTILPLILLFKALIINSGGRKLLKALFQQKQAILSDYLYKAKMPILGII